jgi:hypothetical protein
LPLPELKLLPLFDGPLEERELPPLLLEPLEL